MIIDKDVPLHLWFAWYPVPIGWGCKVWLQYVYREHDRQQWLYYLNKEDNRGEHAAT